MNKPDFNKEIDVPKGMIYLFGYDVVNGVKSSFIPEDKLYTQKELDQRLNELKAQYAPYSVNLYRKQSD